MNRLWSFLLPHLQTRSLGDNNNNNVRDTWHFSETVHHVMPLRITINIIHRGKKITGRQFERRRMVLSWRLVQSFPAYKQSSIPFYSLLKICSIIPNSIGPDRIVISEAYITRYCHWNHFAVDTGRLTANKMRLFSDDITNLPDK